MTEKKRRLGRAGLFSGAVALLTIGAGVAVAGAGGQPPWKGSETFSQTGGGPNPSRCGAFPPNVEAMFSGTGIDTAGGVFAVTASGCLDVEALRVFDLKATDTYVAGGESVSIVAGEFFLIVDPATCVATNAHPVPFEVAGGTGRFAGADGGGRFHFAMNHTPCSGTVSPAHVWFRGQLKPGS